MNKRQRKKNKRKIEERWEFFFDTKKFVVSRQCGKTTFLIDIIDCVIDKSYEKFKMQQKIYINKK